MDQATFHFHGEVNFFLPAERRNTRFTHQFDWKASLKDMVESLGPPHSEIELVVMDGVSVSLETIVPPDVHIDVYFRADDADVADKIVLIPPHPTPPRFVLDTHLGRLANYLRIMGFDTLYRNDYPDDVLAEISHNDERILLTRDIGLLKRSPVIHGRYVRETNPHKQVDEITSRYDLVEYIEPFHRCVTCNGLIQPVDKNDIIDRIPENSAHYDTFRQFDTCGQIYWRGSHFDKMQSFIADVINHYENQNEA